MDGIYHRYTPEQIEFLKGLSDSIINKEITRLFNEKFKSNVTTEKIGKVKRRYKIPSLNPGCFKQKHTPWNKGKSYMPRNSTTRFQKGHTVNNRDLGETRLDRDGYVIVKIGQPSVWKRLHRVLWENRNGLIPDGHVILFGDGDNRNFDINNLICVSRAQLVRLNQQDLIQSDAELTRTALNVVNLQQKIHDLAKN
ncbi:MAG TPA: HNH endonuclease [Epulopiscium sp.]|nr:HNH endonuclease [Candidatus Epulonipiscium sp.]